MVSGPDMFLHLAFTIFGVTMILCSLKVGMVYRKNRNFASILMILSFMSGFMIAIFAILQMVNPSIYRDLFLGALMFYTTALATIFFYITDLKELVSVPFTITFIITLQSLLSIEFYNASRTFYMYIIGFVPIIGFFIVGMRNKDGKSLGFSVHLLFTTIGGMLSIAAPILSSIIYFVACAVLLLGIFGGFDKLLLHEKRTITWIERELAHRS